MTRRNAVLFLKASLCALLIGDCYATTAPQSQQQTISENDQEELSLPLGSVTISTYVNLDIPAEFADLHFDIKAYGATVEKSQDDAIARHADVLATVRRLIGVSVGDNDALVVNNADAEAATTASSAFRQQMYGNEYGTATNGQPESNIWLSITLRDKVDTVESLVNAFRNATDVEITTVRWRLSDATLQAAKPRLMRLAREKIMKQAREYGEVFQFVPGRIDDLTHNDKLGYSQPADMQTKSWGEIKNFFPAKQGAGGPKVANVTLTWWINCKVVAVS